MKRFLLFSLIFFISLGFSGYLIFTKTANSALATCVDPVCADYGGTCGGTAYSDWWQCSSNDNAGDMCCHGSGCPSWVCLGQVGTSCPQSYPYNSSYKLIGWQNVAYQADGQKCYALCLYQNNNSYGYTWWVGSLTPPNCCISCGTDDGDDDDCSDSCNGYQLVDNNNDCVKNSSSCGGSTRYTGGECSVCPLNNNSCSSKYPGNTQTSGNCVIAGAMWLNGNFIVSHNVSFSGSGTLTAYGSIIMQGGTINLAGGYILTPHQ